MHLALFQPDIPQNAGTLLRTCACLGVTAHIIEPAGFPVSDRAFRRAGLDYLDQVEIVRHVTWEHFQTHCRASGQRIIAVETNGAAVYTAFRFLPDDVLLLGRETSGLPPTVLTACTASVVIPMRPELRSLNVAVAGAMVLGEAIRQTRP